MSLRLRHGWPLLVVVAASLLLYVATLPPGLLWGGGDFARFQTWAYTGRIDGSADIFAHPLWVIAAHPFTWIPLRDPAWRASFATAVFAVGALALTFLAARRLSGSLPGGLLATGALAVSHTFWTYAVMPKVYSLHALLLVACIVLLLWWRDSGHDGYLGLWAFVFCLSLLNHLLMATAAAGFAAFAGIVLWQRRHDTGRALLFAALCAALGLLPYMVLMLRSNTLGATGGTVGNFLGGLLYIAVHPAALLRGLGWGVLLGGYQFPLVVPVALFGTVVLWRADRAATLMLWLIIAGTVAFLFGALDPNAGGVYIWNLHYYIQAYMAFALLLAPGFAALWRGWSAARPLRQGVLVAATLLAPIALYALAPVVVRPFMQNMPEFRPLPGRDNLVYVLSPWKQGEDGARPFGEQILGQLPQGSVLFADYSIWAVVRYLQDVEGARRDVELVLLPTGLDEQLPLVRRYAGQPNLYLADTYRYYDVVGISRYYEIVPVPPIYRLDPRGS